MPNLIKRFLRCERGATATEYAMLLVFIALAIATGAQAFSSGLNTWFSNVSASIAGLNSQIPGPSQ
jgi:pilus assembly protein Flp/PilA